MTRRVTKPPLAELVEMLKESRANETQLYGLIKNQRGVIESLNQIIAAKDSTIVELQKQIDVWRTRS